MTQFPAVLPGESATKTKQVRRACVVSFTVAFVTLASQILFHRIISAKLLNNYAFLVISLTMLGFAASGAILSRHLSKWQARIWDKMLSCAGLFVVSSIVITAIFYRAPCGPFEFIGITQFVGILLKTLPYALLFSIPFCFSGLMLGLLLANVNLPANKIYCWDLIGSAVGAAGVLPAINQWGVEKTLLALGFFLVVTTCIGAVGVRKSAYIIPAFAVVLIAFASYFSDKLFLFTYPEGTMLAHASKPNSGWVIEYQTWDPVARIEVSRIPPPERLNFQCLIGENKTFHKRFERMITQNNFAFTYAVHYDGRPESLVGIEETIYAAAYIPQSTVRPKVAIIGVGGGFDILTALYFNAREITGIEVNRATLDILKNKYANYFGAWTLDPRVKLVPDEGRHFLAVSKEFYDIIQLSGVDSYSGTPGAAHVFSENYLYTVEAFRAYYSRLSENGIINIMRLEHQPPREMLRALTTAVAALRSDGVSDPSAHIAVLSSRQKNFVALLIKKSPFTNADVGRLKDWCGTSSQIDLVAAPWFSAKEQNIYNVFLAFKDSQLERSVTKDTSLYNITPTTDDIPFFFDFSRWGHLFSKNRYLQNSVPVMEVTLIVLGMLVGIAAFGFVVFPLRHLRKSESRRVPWLHGTIFALTGLGYLAVEIALLQKFGLFLGHPNYALSVVLAGLLAATGVGALGSTVMPRWLRGPRVVSSVLALVLVFELTVAFPFIHKLQVDDLGLRVAIVLALVTPLGVLMGTFLPNALESLKSISPSFVPWAWGINGVFSVLGPILSIAFSMTWGIDALLWSAVFIYFVVGWIFPGEKYSLSTQFSG